MLIYLAADHRGFFLKEKLKTWLNKKGFQVKDFGNTELNPNDDYPDFVQKLAEELNKNPESKGIIICGSGIGVDIVANRFNQVRCGLGFNEKQIAHGRAFNNINCLALPADFLKLNQAKKLATSFLTTSFSDKARHKRRLIKIDKI